MRSMIATNQTGCRDHASHGMCPLANSQRVTTSYAVQMGTPLANAQKTFSLVWLPNVNRSLWRGQRALYLKRVSWARRMYSRQWNSPYQTPTIAAFRTSKKATQPNEMVRVVAVDGVARKYRATA